MEGGEEEEGGERYRDRLESTTSLLSLEEQIDIAQEKLEMVQSQCPVSAPTSMQYMYMTIQLHAVAM